MGGIGFTEVVLILAVVFVVFGAGKLPEVGQALGKGIKNFKNAMNKRDEIQPKDPQETRKDDQGKDS